MCVCDGWRLCLWCACDRGYSAESALNNLNNMSSRGGGKAEEPPPTPVRGDAPRPFFRASLPYIYIYIRIYLYIYIHVYMWRLWKI